MNEKHSAKATQAQLINADCREAIKLLLDCSVDSVITDPPYELGFMGKTWDASGIAYDVSLWREALRVLKPGGHLLAFGGSRTYHRLACAIEDAGFEIRDQIMWIYSSGFPKSFNLDRLRGESICNCDGSALPYTHGKEAQQTPERDMYPLRNADVSQALVACQGRGEVLQSEVPQQGAPAHREANGTGFYEGSQQPGLERRSDAPEEAGKLRAGEVRASDGMGAADGSQGRLCDGTPASHGEANRSDAIASRDSASPRPQAAEQQGFESGTVAGQSQPQAGRAWPICGRCGKPRVLAGLGTALKPAHEPIVVARKPLIGTVADNVLTHGTGAMNIDGCRIEAIGYSTGGKNQGIGVRQTPGENHERCDGSKGRWPANVIHDGSEEVLAGFPNAPGQSGAVSGHEPSSKTNSVYGEFAGRPATRPRGDSGSAARFFYCAKATRKDRNEGLADPGPQFLHGNTLRKVQLTETKGNTHPTVKPTELMRYLCRLVTPTGGLVLDPFLGSGSTGKAALLEGFRFMGIEKEPEYYAIACARIQGDHQPPEEIVPMPKREPEAEPDLFSYTAA